MAAMHFVAILGNTGGFSPQTFRVKTEPGLTPYWRHLLRRTGRRRGVCRVLPESTQAKTALWAFHAVNGAGDGALVQIDAVCSKAALASLVKLDAIE